MYFGNLIGVISTISNDLKQCSIGSLEFCYGVVSHCKNSLTSFLETRLIMGKAGKCPSIMAPISSTTSLSHHPLRKIPNSTTIDIDVSYNNFFRSDDQN